MMKFETIKEEKANAMVENVIILPIILFIVFFVIIASFVMHDRATLDAAISRGAVYASKCIADPFYANIISSNNKSAGSLDATISDVSKITFSTKKSDKNTGGSGISPYRYFTSSYKKNLESQVKSEVKNIISATKLSWHKINPSDIKCEVNNYVIYQKVTVSAKAVYNLPPFFKTIGLPDKIEYTAVSVASVTDTDEFIRNADLVVDILSDILKRTGADKKLEAVTAKFNEITDKIKNSPIARFFNVSE